MISDKTKVISTIENADVVLIITPQDIYVQNKHLIEQYLFYKKHYQSTETQSKLSTKTGKDGSYQFNFKAIQAYNLKFQISVSNPLFKAQDKQFEEKCLQSVTLTENFELDRITMLTKLHSILLDSNKKPIPNAIGHLQISSFFKTKMNIITIQLK